MKRIACILLFVICSSYSLFAQSKSINVVDTPTAFTVGRGTYLISTLFYDRGGLELKSVIGLHDNIDLGVSFDVQDLIGTETPQPNIPGVIARFQFTDHIGSFPLAIALGYDTLYLGRSGKCKDAPEKYNRVIFGPYVAATHTIYLFDNEQFISYGFRMPVQPVFEPEDTSYFLSFDVPLHYTFRIKNELERVYYDFRDPENWLVNIAARYTYMDQLSIEVGCLVRMDGTVNRVVRLEYHGEF